MPELPPIRHEGQGFLNESDVYLQKLATASLPSELEHLRHQTHWPVDMNNALAHLVLYDGDQDFSCLADDPKPHKGLDVQLPQGTRIFTPESGRVVHVDPEYGWGGGGPRRRLTDIIFFGDSGLIYYLLHLYTPTIPAKLMEIYSLGIEDLEAGKDIQSRDVKMDRGDHLGEVGIFYNRYNASRGFSSLPNGVKIPQDVKAIYGRTYNHLHIQICTTPQDRYWYERLRVNLTYTDPLPLLQKLY